MYVVGAGVALLMEPPPLSVPVKEAREVESAAPRMGNLAGFGGGGSSDPVEPAIISHPLTMCIKDTMEMTGSYHDKQRRSCHSAAILTPFSHCQMICVCQYLIQQDLSTQLPCFNFCSISLHV
jgi:hypothetical protein